MRLLMLILAMLIGPRLAGAQQLSLHLDSEEVYANLPFTLSVVARGFAESPAPTLSTLSIPGCRITPLGVTPNVSSMVQIINGQRSEQRSVSFAFQFRVEAAQAGTYTVPALIAQQGSQKAQSQAARFSVRAVDDTKDMQLRLMLPERPLWVGETVEGALEWYLRRDVGNHSFALPLFDQEKWLEVESPTGEPRLSGFRAGSRQLDLPYSKDKAVLEGVSYTRFRLQFRLTPTMAGTLNVPPARVVAQLQTGFGRDLFGFQVPQSQLFQAVAKPTRLEIRALPLRERPSSFKNAVGSSFGIDVQAGRTVVRVGDPIELRILLRGKGRLAGLILPDLPAMGLLSKEFSTSDEPPSGEVLEDGKGKLFRVSVRLLSTQAREIPALAFSYFDPEQGSYKTVQSQPIALSVKGSALVRAEDVVGTSSAAGGTAKAAKVDVPGTAALSIVGADLALSDEAMTWKQAASLRQLLPLVLGFYGAALLLGVVFAIRVRKQAAWQREAEIKNSLRRLQSEVDAAATQAARDAAPRLCAALRAVQKELELPILLHGEGKELLDRLETETYSPGAVAQPLPLALRTQIKELAQTWARGAKSSQPSRKILISLLLLGFGLHAARVCAQDAAAVQKLKQTRALYQSALSEPNRDERRNRFAEVENTLRELVSAHPNRPLLLSDWGNAALLAQEPGRAVLAYRRALRLDPTLLRAHRNLAFLRDRLPDWLPRARSGGALDSILILNQWLPSPQRQVGLAASVFLAVALLLPWSARRLRLLRMGAVLPLLAIAAFGLSLLGERDVAGDAVVVYSAPLRSADSLGAPPALGHPLPAGAEVSISEIRGDFTRVTLFDGQVGWINTSAVEAVRTAP